MAPRLQLLLAAVLACYTTAFNVGAAVRAPRPALRTAALPVMEEIVEEIVEEEEAMSEEEYLAELEAEEAQKAAAMAGEAEPEEEQLLAPGEAERIKAEIKKRAPWMDIDPEAIARAKKAREERKKEAAGKVDGMRIDPQAAELGAASGLRSKTLSEDEVELRWETSDEVGNAGFIVQRRAGGQADFVTLKSFETFAPLKSKGPSGGPYVYLDSESGLSPGTWVYRILDCDTSGVKSAMCQKLVEIESKDEQVQTFVVGGFIAALALVLVGVGIFIDPIQTTSAGRGF